jgi:uncharacterized protein YerC
MQVSSKQLNKTINNQMFRMLYQIMADSKTNKEIQILVEDLLTESERTAMAKRLAIAVYLDKGRSYENIKDNLKVSSATIAAVAESMGNPGIQKALNMIKAEEWADEWSGKIVGVMKKLNIAK